MRLVLCKTCGEKPLHQQQHREDAAMGFKWRRVEIPRARKPAVHHISINDVPQAEMATLYCDGCGQAIHDGSPAVAISQWREGKLGNWEKEYSQ